MTTYLLDANVILRFLTQDHPESSKAAKALFERAKARELALEADPLIVAEVVYALEGYYRKNRRAVVPVSFSVKFPIPRRPAVRTDRPFPVRTGRNQPPVLTG